jgi:hypothetical protein
VKIDRILSVAVVSVVVVGFVRGWFAMSSDRESKNGSKVNIHLAVDLDRVRHDTDYLRAKVFSAREPTEIRVPRIAEQLTD